MYKERLKNTDKINLANWNIDINIKQGECIVEYVGVQVLESLDFDGWFKSERVNTLDFDVFIHMNNSYRDNPYVTFNMSDEIEILADDYIEDIKDAPQNRVNGYADLESDMLKSKENIIRTKDELCRLVLILENAIKTKEIK